MSQFKVTAVEGLRSQDQDETDSVWDDFYTDEHERRQTALEQEKADTKVWNETAYEDDFEDLQESDKFTETPRINADLSSSSRSTSTEKLDETGSQSSVKKSRRKGKGRKFKSGSNKPPPLNLYQNQLREQLSYSRDRTSSFNQDTMSDQEVRRRRGRKLQRRGQMKKYHSLEQCVEKAGQDRLEQKYTELQELMSRPLIDNRKVHLPPRQARQPKKKLLRGENGFRRSNSGHRMDAWANDSTHDDEEATDRQAYSTIHKLQTSKPSVQAPSHTTHQSAKPPHNTGPSPHNTHPSPYNSRLASKPPVPRRRTTSNESLPSSISELSHPQGNHDNRPSKKEADSSGEEDEDKRFGNVSPRSVHIPTEMHLKYTDNAKLQEWLRQKNIEHRQTKKAERAKKREARKEKEAEVKEREARREKSSERVREWMEMKRKEALKQQKQERRRRKQEAQEQAAVRDKTGETAIKGKRIDRPQSAPAPHKKHTPIKRPESATRLENGAYSAPKPPDTKFVYKRPVSGRVRLMKMQNERNKTQKMEDLTPEEKEKRMRMSYDAWLVTKRKEDTEKRKEAKRQQDLIKSDPEMERLVPELAIRRIDMINSEKKSIDTGVDSIDEDLNKRFGGGEFRKGKVSVSSDTHHVDTTESSLHSLAVEGSASTIVELNTRARPAIAKTHMPIPQSALSPRRPQSAKPSRSASPKVRTIMDTDHMSEPNPFTLPFPDDLGAPLHIRKVQERLFSKQMASQSNENKRPEPQGCASTEPSVCPKDTEASKADSFPCGVNTPPKADTTPRSSLVLLQEIEAAAIKREQETKQLTLSVSEKVFPSNAEESSSTAKEQEPQHLPVTVPLLAADVFNSTKLIADADNKTNANCSSGERKNDAEHSGTDSTGELPEPSLNQQQDQQTEPKSTQSKDQLAESGSEASKPKSLEGDQDTVHDKEDNVTKRESESETEDTLRKSLKRVSFSEDLTTVFETTSAETSSNFDERGDEDEGEDPYMCLDKIPDPDPE